MTELTPDLLLRAYTIGLFPMAETAEDPELFWVDPERRGVIPLEAFHVPRSLRKAMIPLSADELLALEALRSAVAEALERKRRLGQYAVIWRDGRAVRLEPEQIPVPEPARWKAR